MYPKVKVRDAQQQFDRKQKGDQTDSLFKGFDSLSLLDFTSPPASDNNQHEPISPPSIAKVPESYVPRSITPPPAIRVTVKNEKEESEEDHKPPHIRASSIPMPRAVLSSPDNDGTIGSKSKIRGRRSSSAAVKDQSNSGQSRLSKCKFNQLKQTASGSHMDHRPVGQAVAAVASAKTDCDSSKEKRGSDLGVRTRNTGMISKVKPSWQD